MFLLCYVLFCYIMLCCVGIGQNWFFMLPYGRLVRVVFLCCFILCLIWFFSLLFAFTCFALVL